METINTTQEIKCLGKRLGLKTSVYNHRFRRGDLVFLWNTSSGALLKLDAEAEAFMERAMSGEVRAEDEYYLDLCSKNGLVVKVDNNEINNIISRHIRKLENPNPKSLSFVIVPGLGCNFTCNYCFEAPFLGFQTMTEDTQNAVVAFIEQQLTLHPAVKKCSISWFGGEPLLYLPAIEHMSNRLFHFCKANTIKYTASMVTNGRFLTLDIQQRLKKIGVSSIQITIDGTQYEYCKAKHATPQDFFTVIENLTKAASLFRLSVRVNANRDNYDDAFSLTRWLLSDLQLDGHIRMYLAFVRHYDNSYEEDQKAQVLFDKTWIRYAKWMMRTFSPRSFGMTLPKARSFSNCGLICRGNACIGPEGELYRCEHDVGNPQAVSGTVYDGIIRNSWFDNFETFPDSCQKCVLFPVCFGGCRHDLVHSSFSVNCESFMERMEEAILIKHLMKLK